MVTKIEIDNNLMQQAMESSKLKSKKEIVEAGLKELIRIHAQNVQSNVKCKIDTLDNYEPWIEG